MRKEFIKSGIFIAMKKKPKQSLTYHKEDVAYKIIIHKSLRGLRHKKNTKLTVHRRTYTHEINKYERIERHNTKNL